MNRNELLLKLAYEVGFQRALLGTSLDKEAFDWSKLKGLFGFATKGPKNIAGGSFKKWQKQQAPGAPRKSTKELMSGGLGMRVRPMEQRMRPTRA